VFIIIFIFETIYLDADFVLQLKELCGHSDWKWSRKMRQRDVANM